MRGLLFTLASIVTAAAAIAVWRLDRNLGKALRFEITPWTP